MTRQKRTRVDYFDDPVQLGRRLREAREAAGLSQRELSFPGCTAAYISRIEKGERVPSLQLIREFAQQLEVNEEWLARGRRPNIEAHIWKELPDDLGKVAISVTAYTDGRAKTVDLETTIYEGADEALQWMEEAVISSFTFWVELDPEDNTQPYVGKEGALLKLYGLRMELSGSITVNGYEVPETDAPDLFGVAFGALMADVARTISKGANLNTGSSV